jgi:hypothetical protein
LCPEEGAWRFLMRKLCVILLVLFHCAFLAEAQESFTAYGSTVIYARPDSSNWSLVNNEMDAKSNKFLLLFKRNPVEDPQGRRIEPVIALICEPVTNSSNVIEYSISKRAQVPFNVKKMLTCQGGDFAYPNSVGYEGEYDKGVIHNVLIGHLRHKEVGVQIICDATDGVYSKVEQDMRNFLRSVNFKE